MDITSNLEKLTSLKDRGELSQSEFDKAKALLLSENRGSDDPNEDSALASPPATGEKESKKQLIAAILSTVAVALFSGSAIIAPSFINILAAVLFVVGSVLSWTAYANLKKQSRELGSR